MDILYRPFLLFFLLFLFQAQPGFSQIKLQGTVETAHHPIASANVVLSPTDGETQHTIQTDSSGSFQFSLLKKGDYRLSVYSPGFENTLHHVSLVRDTVVKLTLQPLSKSLNEVQIAGTKQIVERKPDRLIFNVASSIGASGGSSLEAIQQTPGVKISGNSLSLSGSGALAVMIDGQQLHLSGENLTRYLRSLPASRISRIEVITHPSAALDAAGGGGVLNIITKKSEKLGFNGNMDVSLKKSLFDPLPDYSVSNYGYFDPGLNLTYTTPKWSTYLSSSLTRGRQMEGYSIDIFYPQKHWSMSDSADFKHAAYQILGGADYKISNRSTLGGQYLFSHGMYRGADHIHAPVYGINGQPDSTLRTFADYHPLDHSHSANLHLQHGFLSGGTMALNADYFNYYRTDKSSFSTGTYNKTANHAPIRTAHLTDTSKQDIHIYTLKADFSVPGSFAQWAFGGKLSFIDNYSDVFYFNQEDNRLIPDATLSDAFQYNENTQALYFTGSKEMDQWKFEIGLRAEYTQTKGLTIFRDSTTPRSYFKLYPSALISYRINSDNRLLLNVDRRIDRPDFWTLNPYKSLMTAYSYLEGNPYLQPQNTTRIEVSYHYKSRFITSVWLNMLQDGFTRVTHAFPDSALIYTQPLNFIRSNTWGITESISLSPLKWWDINDQAKLYYTHAHSDLSYIPSINGWGLYLDLRNNFALNSSKTLMGEVNFWSQFPEIDVYGRSKTYYSLDAGVKALLLDKKLTIFLAGHDLLRHSVPIVNYQVNGLQQTFTNFQVFSYIQIGASFQFGKGQKRDKIRTGNEEEKNRAG